MIWKRIASIIFVIFTILNYAYMTVLVSLCTVSPPNDRPDYRWLILAPVDEVCRPISISDAAIFYGLFFAIEAIAAGVIWGIVITIRHRTNPKR